MNAPTCIVSDAAGTLYTWFERYESGQENLQNVIKTGMDWAEKKLRPTISNFT